MRLLFVAILLSLALPAEARKPHVRKRGAARLRVEDDPRKKSDSPVFARARVAFDTPEDRAELPPGDVAVAISVSGYALGNGPHLHLIVDNEPALQLERDGAYVIHGLETGPHVIRAVLCRPWHEVVKAHGAFALARFWLGPPLPGKAGKAAEYVAWPDPKKPLLTYVLPVGRGQRGFELWREDGAVVAPPSEPEKPVLDFFISGAKLARRGAKIRIVLDRRELPLITEWKPQHLRRAHAGAHKITIDLLDRRGRKVHNAVNRSDRVFTAR